MKKKERKKRRERTCNLKLSSNFRCIYFEVSLDISARSGKRGRPRWCWNEQAMCVCTRVCILYFGYFPLRRVNGARLVKSDGWCKIQRIWNSVDRARPPGKRPPRLRRFNATVSRHFHPPGQTFFRARKWTTTWIPSTSWKLAIVASLLGEVNRKL